MSSQPKAFLTPEQYLEIERKAEVRSEYHNGEMFAMSGASIGHLRICGNLMRTLGNELLDTECVVVSNDLRVHVPAAGLYTYPDIVGFCGEPMFSGGQPDNLLNPKIIIEILSPSTEAYDRGQKFKMYRSIESLAQYVLVSSTEPNIEVFSRGSGDQWTFDARTNLDDFVELTTLHCRVQLADIYRKVSFPEAPSTHSAAVPS